ncbi:MAG: inositol monophosphatase family protein [Anaerolineales bacterium]
MSVTLNDLEGLARGAGAILREGYSREHDVRYKGVIDPVTEIDRASEEFLIGEIAKRFPFSRIVAEESGEQSGEGQGAWYIDPLDGTVNYAHAIPFFCVSIAYAEGGVLKLGAVYDPMRDEMFLAERGRGATLNGLPIHASAAQSLERSLLVTGFPYDTWNTELDNFKNFERLAKMTQGVRRLGSAALDACYVGAGRLDGFWELSLKAWDVAAGALIAEEGGARVANMRGDQNYFSAPYSILAAAPGIYAAMKAALENESPRRA